MIVHSHDFNDTLDGKSLSEVREGWEEEPIMQEWTRYAQSQMGEPQPSLHALTPTDGMVGEDLQEGDREIPAKKKKTPAVLLEFDKDGKPLLPDPDFNGGMRVESLCSAVRQFIVGHYRKEFVPLQIHIAFNVTPQALHPAATRSSFPGDR